MANLPTTEWFSHESCWTFFPISMKPFTVNVQIMFIPNKSCWNDFSLYIQNMNLKKNSKKNPYFNFKALNLNVWLTKFKLHHFLGKFVYVSPIHQVNYVCMIIKLIQNITFDEANHKFWILSTLQISLYTWS